uniref:Secreted protein n=1 Tax=Phakopsora pachyrhizi TaxID=170000 RepID=A0A0S1MJN6_PHAPC
MRACMLTVILGLSALQSVISGESEVTDVCDIDDNDAAADACAMKKSFGGSPFFNKNFPNFSPAGALYVQYGNVVVGGAQQLSPSRVYAQPSLTLSLIDTQSGDQKYTTVCIDTLETGEVSRTLWAQTGLILDPNTSNLVSTAQPVLPYTSPDPSPSSGTHEYIFFVLREERAGLLGNTLNLNGLLSKIADISLVIKSLQQNSEVVAVSYFKSRYDGIAINGKQANAQQTSSRVAEKITPSISGKIVNANLNAGSAQLIPTRLVNTTHASQIGAANESDSNSDETAEDSISESDVDLNSKFSGDSTKTASTQGQNVASNGSIIIFPTVKPVQPLKNGTSREKVADNKSYEDLCELENDAASDGCAMASAFAGSSIFPKILPSFTPLGALYVQYDNVILGGAQQMAPNRVRNQPNVKFSTGVAEYKTSGKSYFMILANTAEMTRSVGISWAQEGITINENTGEFSYHSSLCKYISPQPSAAETRSYVFLLFEQPQGYSTPAKYMSLFNSINSSNENSIKIDLDSFASDNGFGTPIGGSFFKSSKQSQDNTSGYKFRRSFKPNAV